MALNDNEKYWFIKIFSNYLNKPVFVKIKRHPNGKSIILAYIELILLAGEKGGKIEISGYYDTPEEELSDILRGYDRSELQMALNTCKTYGLINQTDDQHLFFPEAKSLTASINRGSIRKAEYRDKIKKGINHNITDYLSPTEINISTASLAHAESDETLSNVRGDERETMSTIEEDHDGTVSPRNIEQEQEQELELYNNNNNTLEDYNLSVALLAKYGIYPDSACGNEILSQYNSDTIKEGIKRALGSINSSTKSLSGLIISNIKKMPKGHVYKLCSKCKGEKYITDTIDESDEYGNQTVSQKKITCPVCKGKGYEE